MDDPPLRGPRDFATTQWSLVLAARTDEAQRSNARKAFEALCRAYWYPIYAFVRHRGYDSDEAQDLTQSFFARVIETDGLASADPRRGRFRSYLLGAIKHFLANEWHRSRTQKRGGRVSFLDLDALDPAARFALAEDRTHDPDASFDREWAHETIARALARLRAESEARGRGEWFEALRGSLVGEAPARSATAARLGTTEGALKTAVHRLRRRYRELLRAEIAETVADADDVDREMRHLVEVLRRE
jgi:RNA polymerase sigma-70 factor (ECF subfamily)